MSSYLPQQYNPQYQAQFWQELIAIAVNIMILIALASWIFSSTKKALRGEEVELPPLERLGR